MNTDEEIAELQKKYNNVMEMEVVFKIAELKKALPWYCKIISNPTK